MAWIETHQKLEKHPKLLELLSLTNWTKDETIGKLIRLWWWALDYAEDGDLSRYKPQQFLGDLLGNPKDNLTPEILYKYLQDTNFIEKNGLIHDWLDYAGHYLHSKYHSSNPKKWQQIKKKYKAYLRSSFRRPLGPNNLTNLTLPNQPNNKEDTIKDFFDYFLLKTKKDFKLTVERIKLIKKRIKDGFTYEQLRQAVDNFVQDDWEGRPKLMDLVYCIGVRNKIDNLEKWLNYKPKIKLEGAAGRLLSDRPSPINPEEHAKVSKLIHETVEKMKKKNNEK